MEDILLGLSITIAALTLLILFIIFVRIFEKIDEKRTRLKVELLEPIQPPVQSVPKHRHKYKLMRPHQNTLGKGVYTFVCHEPLSARSQLTCGMIAYRSKEEFWKGAESQVPAYIIRSPQRLLGFTRRGNAVRQTQSLLNQSDITHLMKGSDDDSR